MQNQITILSMEMPPPDLEPMTMAALVGKVTMKDGEFVTHFGLLKRDEDIEFYVRELDVSLLSILRQRIVKKVMTNGTIEYLRKARVKVYCHGLSPGVLSIIEGTMKAWKCEGHIFDCEEVESDHIE